MSSKAENLGGTAQAAPQVNDDLGFGARVTEQARGRFLNRDGTFNVVRRGESFLRTLNPYHALVTMSWPRFYALLVAAYLAVNLVFAVGYVLCGPDALHVFHEGPGHGRFFDSFFFSVQTLATIGYGAVSPVGLGANLLVALEALVGVVGFSLATGLTFARFARPGGQFRFSDKAVIAPYRGITGFMFRVINPRSNQVLQVNAVVSLSRYEDTKEGRKRVFHALPLERRDVVFLPLHWTIVHPVDEKSPLFGVGWNDLRASEAEFVVLVTATDETSAQVVTARRSYIPGEIVCGARFRDMFVSSEDGRIAIDVRRLSDVEPV